MQQIEPNKVCLKLCRRLEEYYTRKNYQYCTLNGVISICIRYVPIRDTDAAIVTTSVFKM